ncbi:MAG: class I SAM-dependent methyltransferase [Synechococcaceae cyanobacterium SM2_3_1]|nr:class I SAM-dependent methyltransferase [Synechococcaceae cyanobacterium SM2_3_1]
MTQATNNLSIPQESFDAIKEAHTLSGDADKLRDYYDVWAAAYDSDVSNEMYKGPHFISEFYDRMRLRHSDANRSQSKVMDAGCGTGLVGVILQEMGYRWIDGFDLSDKMVEVAGQTGSYVDLKGSMDLTERMDDYSDNAYDATLACGVFTLGHVPPDSLEELIRITRQGGWVVVSTRKSYYNSTNFQEVVDRLQVENVVKLVEVVKDGPYIAEEGAHYWALQVC